jgi:hypothetical protein
MFSFWFGSNGGMSPRIEDGIGGGTTWRGDSSGAGEIVGAAFGDSRLGTRLNGVGAVSGREADGFDSTSVSNAKSAGSVNPPRSGAGSKADRNWGRTPASGERVRATRW